MLIIFIDGLRYDEAIKNIDIVVSDKKYEYDRKLIYVRLNRWNINL